jgi:hypothetical protein
MLSTSAGRMIGASLSDVLDTATQAMGRTHQRKDSPRAQRVGSAPH